MDDTALRLGEQRCSGDLGFKVQAARAVDAQHAAFKLAVGISAARWQVVFARQLAVREVVLEDEVDHALVRRIAEAQRDFLGQDFHAADRFGRDRAHFAKAGDPPAVDENHRMAAAPPPPTAGLRADRIEQFGDRGSAVGGYVRLIEGEHRRKVGVDLSGKSRGDDDDILTWICASCFVLVGRWLGFLCHRSAGCYQYQGSKNEAEHGSDSPGMTGVRIRPSRVSFQDGGAYQFVAQG
jgi:hypothetical protein